MTADPSATTSARRSGSCAGSRGSTACWNRATRRSRHCSARPSSSRVRSHSQSASCQLARRSGQRSPVAAAGRARARRPAASRGGRAGSFLGPGVLGAGQALAASRTSFSNPTATSARGWQPMASQMSKHIRSGSAESPSANTTSRSMSLLSCSVAPRRGSEQDDLDRTAVLKDPIESLVEAPAVRLAVATIPGGLRHGRPSPSRASHSNRAARGRRAPRSLRR